MFKASDLAKVGLFLGGVIFGTAGGALAGCTAVIVSGNADHYSASGNTFVVSGN